MTPALFLRPVARRFFAILGGLLLLLLTGPLVQAVPQATDRLKVLFLGDSGKLEPAERMADLVPYLLDRNIELFYSEDSDQLLSPDLGRYHAILVYGDHPDLPAPKEAALLKYVENGGGLVAVHSAGMNFPKSAVWTALIGARSTTAEGDTFTTKTVAPQHPLMAGAQPFESWDLPLVHTGQVDKDRTVLSQRIGKDGQAENWTWVRTQGKGRVFYTGWGRDYRTWINPGFRDLMERAIRWTAGQDVPAVLAKRPLNKPFTFRKARIPYNPPRDRNHPDIRKKDWPEMQQPLSPEESMKRMITPAGFEVRLFASDPDIHKVIAMTWDERGRLWVAETVDYPNDLHPGTGKDRISICEDTNGDGKADKFTVFADNLNIPTGILYVNGGVIVECTTQTLFLKDTNGDDKADVRTVLFEGWGVKDTHAGPNNLYYGLDNWVWGAVGYSGFKGSVGGENFDFANGLYRFSVDGKKLEALAQGYRNVRGIGFTEDGDYLSTGANGAPSIGFPIPHRYYDMAKLPRPKEPYGTYRSARGLAVHRNIRQWDGYGIYTAGTGHYVYTARSYPQRYWNKVAFVNEPSLGVVGEFELKLNGTNYQTFNSANLLASDDEWFSPILSEVGPDGSVWVLDWYNFIIQHNPTPGGWKGGIANAFESEERDKTHARVYRVVYTGATAKAEPAVSLAKATPDQLVAALASPNLFWRTHAQRLLVERAKPDVAPKIAALLNSSTADSTGQNPGAIHAAWTLRGIGALDDAKSEAFAAVVKALKNPVAGVRRHAALALPPSAASLNALLASGVCEDKDVRVRIAAFEALAEQAPADAATAKMAMTAIERGLGDGAVRVAATAALAKHSPAFLTQGGQPSPAVQKAIEQLGKKEAAPVDTGEKRFQITIGVKAGEMKYDPDRVKVKAGEKVRLTFNNNDLMEHNLVIIKPGTIDKVGALADQMAASPEGAARGYVPKSPDVLWSMPVLEPRTKGELLFTAPNEPGEYPYICTFPGHWRVMRGLLVVEAAK